jgi:hypothetical protein
VARSHSSLPRALLFLTLVELTLVNQTVIFGLI